jgi:hypothetical protein
LCQSSKAFAQISVFAKTLQTPLPTHHPLTHTPHKVRTRGEINNIDLRSDLIEVARLLDHLAPDHHDPDYHLQKAALVHELRRLAKRARRLP